jgi:HPr kinase/phosphorylase
MSQDRTVHASAALLGERGVVIRGRSGSGKSSLLLLLLAADPRAHRLVADDRVILEPENGRLLAAAPAAIAGRLEIRGQGIVHRSYVSPVVVRVVIDLEPPERCPRMPSAEDEMAVIEGIPLPRLILPIGSAEAWPRLRVALERIPPFRSESA